MKLKEVEEELLRIIHGGGCDPDGRLPAERKLCEQLQVSRTTLRKAFDILEAKGVIWRHVGRGTFAGQKGKSPPPSLLQISETTSSWELMELRLIVEPQIARLAAIRASQGEITFLQNCIEKSDGARDPETYEIWDATLHRAVAEAAHNSLILSVFEAVNTLRNLTSWGRLRALIVSPDGMIAHWHTQHRRFVEAIADRDPARAEELARFHVEDVFRKMREGVGNTSDAEFGSAASPR